MMQNKSVTLRDFQLSDKEKLLQVLNNPLVTQYLSSKIPSPYTEQDAVWWINEGSREGFVKAICYEGKFVGCIGVNPGEFEYQRCAELGYWLDSDYWRKGITSEAISLLVSDVFSNTDIVRIFASVFSPNIASKQLLLKSGFFPEAVLKTAIFKDGRFYDNHLFAMLK
ncbi:GNAT family N-acetyltransferase [Pseudoalteromonas phenolica]|uniref:GNAT family N-acetyltransferase n=1 Tax=Pseudoalteromonas phenolica TaxID=161398 RepID=UPI00385039B9